jgi:enoyl-CoA hydratase
MDLERIRLDIAEQIAYLRLNRPDKRNAMDDRFFRDLGTAVARLRESRDVRAVIVCSTSGDFSVGLDLSSLASSGAGDQQRHSPAAANLALYGFIRRLQEVLSDLAKLPAVTIAAIPGYCLGGGLDLAAACDLRIGAPESVYSIRETRMAMVADLGSLQRLLPVIGLGALKEMALTGADFDAGWALRVGLINKVAKSSESLLEEAEELARSIAANSPLAVRGAKHVIDRSLEAYLETNLEYVALWNAAYLRSGDLSEAVAAFFEKRPPRFQGD